MSYVNCNMCINDCKGMFDVNGCIEKEFYLRPIKRRSRSLLAALIVIATITNILSFKRGWEYGVENTLKELENHRNYTYIKEYIDSKEDVE